MHSASIAPLNTMAKRARRRSSSPLRADLSRLLDPSYLPRSASSASSSPDSAYVDDHGDLHDPDYRDFPILAPPAWETVETDAHSLIPPTRPLSPRERRRARYAAESAAHQNNNLHRPTYSYFSEPSAYAFDSNTEKTQPASRRSKLRTLSARHSRSPERYAFTEEEDQQFSYSLADENGFEEPDMREPKEEPYIHQNDWT
jgi:hypothetical protein